MNHVEIEKIADELRQRLGGKIFAFPVESDNPLSKYAVTMYTNEGYRTFPEPLEVSDAAAGIAQLIEGIKELGVDFNYDRDVKFVSYDIQLNGPSITMRRMKKYSEPITAGFKKGTDYFEPADGSDTLLSARGLLKISYIMLIDEKKPTAVKFMDEYYKLLSMRKYGKTAAAIKQEVRRMSKNEGLKWLERTYERYMNSGSEIFDIMNKVKNLS